MLVPRFACLNPLQVNIFRTDSAKGVNNLSFFVHVTTSTSTDSGGILLHSSETGTTPAGNEGTQRNDAGLSGGPRKIYAIPNGVVFRDLPLPFFHTPFEPEAAPPLPV